MAQLYEFRQHDSCDTVEYESMNQESLGYAIEEVVHWLEYFQIVFLTWCIKDLTDLKVYGQLFAFSTVLRWLL